MSRPWYKTRRWIYRPVSWPGFVLSARAFVFSIQVFLAVDRASHSVSDTFYGIFPYLVPRWMLTYWVASKTSAARA